MRRGFFALLLAALTVAAGCSSDAPAERTEEVGTAAATEIKTAIETTSIPDSDRFPPFTGVEAFGECVNEPSSMNNKKNVMQFFCCSEDTVYFSSPADGLRLYSYDGESVKRLSDIPAFSLNYCDGSVYFLSSDALINFEAITDQYGTPYRYDVESETVFPLGDTSMSNLRVDEKGIGYTLTDENGETGVYRYDPQSGESERLYRGFSVQHFGDYSLINEVNESGNGIRYFLENDRERLWLMSDAIAWSDCIKDGVYYYRNYHEKYHLYSIDLQSGEKKLLYGDVFQDYTVFEGTLYLAIQGKLCRMDREDGLLTLETEGGFVENGKGYGYDIGTLYVGNGKMYALVSYSRGRTNFYRIAELEFTDQGKGIVVHEIG